jgi:hypothetical protein
MDAAHSKLRKTRRDMLAMQIIVWQSRENSCNTISRLLV